MDRLRERLDSEEPLLLEAFPAVQLNRDTNTVVLGGYRLPPGWSHDVTDVLFEFPLNYPAGCPDNVCVRADLTLANGQMPANNQGNQTHAGREWLQLSWHIDAANWAPTDDPSKGSNLVTYLIRRTRRDLMKRVEMSKLTFTNQNHWSALEAHFSGGPRERFAFAHTKLLRETRSGPLLEVIGVELVEDAEVDTDGAGWLLADDALDRVHNAALGGGYGLIEFHNHHLGPPGFSHIDEAGLAPMAKYVTSLMPDRPYGAAVYADGRIHAEYWTREDEGIVREHIPLSDCRWRSPPTCQRTWITST